MKIMIATVLVFYAFGCNMIYQGVKQYADEAREIYGNDAVSALIARVKDEQAPFEKRNSAIWALGQIGDPRALPILQALDTDEVQQPPYDSTTCIVQYGVEKAIKQIRRFSLTRWMYHWL